MKKTIALTLALLLLVFSASACAVQATSPAETSASNGVNDLTGKEIVVILKNNTAPFFISVAEGAKKAGEDLGVKVTVKTPVNTTEGSGNEEQTQLAEQSIANQADAVVMCPVDSKAIVPAVQKLVKANIPVINLNTRIADATLSKTFVGLENVEQGYETAKALLEGMGGKGNMFIIEGSTGAQTSIDRVTGAMKAIAEYPDVKVVAQQSANYNRAEALNVVQNLLQSYPDVNAIFCCNDEMALGSAEAVDAAGKTGKILISGQDANNDAVAALKADKIFVTSYGDPFMQGYTSVQAAVSVLKGEDPGTFVEVKTKIVNKANADTFMNQ